MGKTRRKFGAEFTREAARQALQPSNAVATSAQDLSGHESVLCRLIKEYGSGSADKAVVRPLQNAQSQGI